jgi:hypothetical protein
LHEEVLEVERPSQPLPAADDRQRMPNGDHDVAMEALREPLGRKNEMRLLDDRASRPAVHEASPCLDRVDDVVPVAATSKLMRQVVLEIEGVTETRQEAILILARDVDVPGVGGDPERPR